MDRHDIRIRRVPTGLAWQLASELEKRIPLKDIYFARRADKTAEKWKVYDIEDEEGRMNPDFKDVVLKFAPSSALKALAIDALGIKQDDILLFEDIEIDKRWRPNEVGYAPFAKALVNIEGWNGTWPDVIQRHIDHWEHNQLARDYAEKDVVYLQQLYEHFNKPEMSDDDSILACMVAAVRWRGFKVDLDKIRTLRFKSIEAKSKAPTAPSYVKQYIWPHLSDTERVVVGNSTKKVILEEIATWGNEAANRARAVLNARMAQKEVELYDKLILAERFHASFKIIGTLSSRMAGADGLNPQGIKNTKEVKSAFLLAWEEFMLCGGDFESFEVAIAESVYNDPKLREDLLSGKKIHGLFAEALFPEEDYDSILASKGTEEDLYTKGKQGVFSQIYGGNEHTLMTRLGIHEDEAAEAKRLWEARYPGIKKAQQEIHDNFCSMRQPGGIGTQVVWHEPSEFIESKLGFRRYFTLENTICKTLFDLGENPPKGWLGLKIKVHRRDREQTATGATRSALFGAAFAIQAANMRAAANHVIQSTGSQITKKLQRELWSIQPSGVHPFMIMPLNVHDEIMAPTRPSLATKVTDIVNRVVDSYVPVVPLIGMDWTNGLGSWADK
jgi:hypothetical protein